jgi:uncharacterized membrane protein
MLKLKAFVIAGLMLGTPALSQQPAPAQNPAGLSEDGRKIIQDYMVKRSSDIEPLLQRKRQLQTQFDALLTAETYDEAKLASIMADMRDVEGRLFDAMGSTMLALLKALPENDRAIFMKSLSKRPTAVASNPAAGPSR